jgi:protoporphyrinogen oxidase
MILREREAYPVYDKNYKENLNIVKNYLLKFNNLYLMGRNGLHQYNNMDIAMLSAFDATEKFLGNFDRENIYLAGHKKNRELNL